MDDVFDSKSRRLFKEYQKDILTAYKNAYLSDSISIFGGIVALNKEVSLELDFFATAIQ